MIIDLIRTMIKGGKYALLAERKEAREIAEGMRDEERQDTCIINVGYGIFAICLASHATKEGIKATEIFRVPIGEAEIKHAEVDDEISDESIAAIASALTEVKMDTQENRLNALHTVIGCLLNRRNDKIIEISTKEIKVMLDTLSAGFTLVQYKDSIKVTANAGEKSSVQH